MIKVLGFIFIGLLFFGFTKGLSNSVGITKQDGDNLSYIPLIAADLVESAMVVSQVNKVQAGRTQFEKDAARRGLYCQCDKPGLNECFSYHLHDCVDAGLAERPAFEWGASEY